MSVFLKRLWILVVTITGAVLIELLAVIPYRINDMKSGIESAFDRLDTAAGNPMTARIVRSNIDTLQKELRLAPTDPDLYMELAAEYRFLRRNDDAVTTYRRLLRYHRRPEIFTNLANVQFAEGDIAGAIDSYAHAVAFWPPRIDTVPDTLRPQIQQRADEIVRQVSHL